MGETRNTIISNDSYGYYEKYEIIILIVLMLIVFIITYKVIPLLFINYHKKKSKGVKSAKINRYDKISANEYTFFVLSLLMPFLFLEFSTKFDYLVLGIVLIFIIIIMVKTEYIIINPIFLFSGYKIYYSTFTDGDTEFKGYILLKNKDVLTEDCARIKLFENVYFLYKKT